MKRSGYYCKELDHGDANSMCIDAPPSYEFEDEEDYTAQLTRCRRLQKTDPKAYERQGCHREAHMMIEGGRRQLRHTDVLRPRDPYKGGPETSGKERSDASKERLKTASKPFDARTQSERIRETMLARENPSSKQIAPSTKRRLVERVRQAIDAYRQGGVFEVPNPNDPAFEEQKAALVTYGMPVPVLETLLRRSRMPAYGARVLPDIPLSDTLMDELGASLQASKGSIYLLRSGERRKSATIEPPVPRPHNADLIRAWPAVSPLGALLAQVELIGPNLRYTAKDISTAFEDSEWVKASDFFDTYLKAKTKGLPEITDVRFMFNLNPGRKDPVIARVNIPLTKQDVVTYSVRTRYAQLRFTLEELPDKLVSITYRTPHRGRYLAEYNSPEAPVARSNLDFNLARRPAPAIRPNPNTYARPKGGPGHSRLSEFRAEGQATFEQEMGPFGAGSDWTDGIQPASRRNPKPQPKPKPKPQPKVEKNATARRDPRLMRLGTMALVKLAKGNTGKAKAAAAELVQRDRDPKTGDKR